MFPIVLVGAAAEPFNAASLTDLEGKIPGFRFPGGDIANLFTGQFGIVNLIFFVAGALIILYSISAGIGFMTSTGNPQAIAANKMKLMNAIVGFILLISAYWIVQIVAAVLGLQSVTTTFQ